MNDRILENLKQQHININLRYGTQIANILAQATPIYVFKSRGKSVEIKYDKYVNDTIDRLKKEQTEEIVALYKNYGLDIERKDKLWLED
jgi:hypothetical protein